MTDNGLSITRSIADEEDLTYFCEAIFILFRAGIQYPLGHTQFDRLIDGCLQQLHLLLSLEGSVNLELESQRLLFNGRHLDQENASNTALHTLLQQAGVAGISFHRSLAHSHLLLATRKLLTRRTGTSNDPAEAGEQRTDLPCGIKVRFSQDAVVSDADDPPVFLLQQIAELATRLPRVRGQRLQLEMTSLLRRGGLHLPGFPFATGRDATELFVTAASANNLPEAARRCGYGERDTAILMSFVDTLADFAFKVSEESQLTVVCRSWCKLMAKKAHSPHPSPAMVSKERGGRSCSTAALQRFVSVQRGQTAQEAPMRCMNRRPMLSLVLQQVESAFCQPSTNAWRALLGTLLQAPLQQSEWRLLKAAVAERLEVFGVGHFHALCVEVIPALRRSSPLSSARCLLELWDAVPPALHMHLWPYAADELLLSGMAGAKRDYYQLCQRVGSMPMEVMDKQRSLLERQPVFSGRDQVAARVFCPAYTSTYCFFAFLLNTSLREQIAATVIAELRQAPQDELIAAVIFLLHPDQEAHVCFLSNYLRHTRGETFPEPLTGEASRLMVDLLPQLDEKSREEPWVESTISTMAVWHGEGTVKVLENIVEQRCFAIMPAWNKRCRRAAEIALQCLCQKSAAQQTSRGSVQER